MDGQGIHLHELGIIGTWCLQMKKKDMCMWWTHFFVKCPPTILFIPNSWCQDRALVPGSDIHSDDDAWHDNMMMHMMLQCTRQIWWKPTKVIDGKRFREKVAHGMNHYVRLINNSWSKIPQENGHKNLVSTTTLLFFSFGFYSFVSKCTTRK